MSENTHPSSADRLVRVRGDRVHIMFLLGAVVSFAALVWVSFFVSSLVERNNLQLAQNRFEQELNSVQGRIQERLDAHVNALYGAQGLFLASEEVTRSEWHDFVEGLRLHRRFPGISGLAYLERVEEQDLQDFVQSVRTDTTLNSRGYPDYQVHPEGGRDVYYAVKYVQPLEGNENMFGLDAGAYRRATLERIGDTNTLTSIGRIDFGNGQQEHVFILPVYNRGAQLQSVQDRRNNLTGFVAAAMSTQGLLEGIDLSFRENTDQYVLEVLDANQILIRIGTDQSNIEQYPDSERLILEFPLQSAGLSWTIRGIALRTFGMSPREIQFPILTFLSGLGISWLLFTVLYLFLSARKRALRIARRMTRELGKFQLAVRNATNHIIITDAEGVIVYANPAVERTTGYSSKEVIGRTPNLWGGRMDPTYYTQMWKTIKEEKRPFAGEVVNRRKNGEEYDALLAISPILDRAGNLYGYVGIEEDITVRKKLERAKSEFVSLASHQLRTPLTAMRLTLETMGRDAHDVLSPDQRDMLKHALEYAMRMSETIHTMLTISHVEAGKVTMRSAEISICTLFKDLMSQYQIMYERRALEIVVECEEGLIIQSDEKLLREVVSNLLSNAVKYTPHGGTITLRGKKDGDAVVIEVADTGMGIPTNQQHRVFQKFFRGANIVRKSTDGTGLGLYLVHSLITLLHGSISFQSEENSGTTFTITLPSTPPTNG